MARKLIVIFVEGETEKEFYNSLIQYYRQHTSKKLTDCKVINLGGINRFETKMALRLQNDILNKNLAKDIEVVCCYDTDVFDFAKRPPVNWDKVKARIADLGIAELTQVKASRMIEDWFLSDLPGICKFLKIKEVKKAEGKDGNDKMIKLFKKGNKLYIKGSPASKFISALNLETIRTHAASQLAPLEKLLNFSIPVKVIGKSKK